MMPQTTLKYKVTNVLKNKYTYWLGLQISTSNTKPEVISPSYKYP
jgi:hypothetical protein